jgi:predicted component of type VI protein secretion system
MKLRIRVTPGHRFAELSLVKKDGSKLWIDQGPRYTTVDTKDLADGEEYTIGRYEHEGRFQINRRRRAAAATAVEPDTGP